MGTFSIRFKRTPEDQELAKQLVYGLAETISNERLAAEKAYGEKTLKGVRKRVRKRVRSGRQ